MLDNLIMRLRALFQRSAIENELDAELHFHLDQEVDKLVAAGLSREEARRRARINFGGSDRIKEECREARGVNFLEAILPDIRFGLRMMRKNPGFTAVTVMTLALGVGANTAIFSVLNGIILRPLPYQRPAEIVVLRQQFVRTGIQQTDFSVAELNDYRQQNSSLSSLVEYHEERFVLQSQARTERVRAGVVSSDFFDFLGVSPILGRSFVPSDEQAGAPPALLLGYDYWKGRQNGDSEIVGKTLKIDGRVNIVIGVLPPLPQYPDENDVYMPTTSSSFRMWPERISNRNRRFSRAFARLKPGVTLQQANSDLEVIASRLRQQYPASYLPESGYRAFALPLEQELTSKARPTLWVLSGAAIFVLLIACANVANFTLARLSKREQELALRAALGASRTRLVRQLVTESLLLGIFAAGLGLILALASNKLLVEFVARLTPRARDISIDGGVLLFAMTSAVLTSVVTGSALAFSSRYQLGSGLKDVARQTTAGTRQRHVRSSLIVAQVAFSLALLSGAGLMLRSFIKLQRVDPGFAQERVLTMALDLDSSKYATPADEVVAGHAIVDKVESLPGVVSAAISSSFPLDPDALAMGYNTVAMFTSRILIEGKPVPAGEVVPLVPYRLASTDYFKTLGIPLTQGRTFLPTDKQGAPGVIVVNQAFARHRLAPDDPIGKRISWDGGKTWLSVVGVVGNTKEFSLKENLSDEVYYPMDQVPIGAVGSLLVRTAVNPMSISREIQRAIRDAAPDTAVSYLTTLEDARKDTLVAPRVMTSLLSLFAGLALAVAASGIGGILALSVSQRVKEIGIRLAVGATPWDVLTMIVKQGLILVAIGLVCGLGITLAMARTLQAFLFDVAPADPLTLTAVCALLGITALVACYIPARRATKINPVVALQHE